MQLADLSDVLEPDDLILPIRGVEYRVPPCSAADWLRFQKQLRKVELAQSVGRPLAEIAEDGDPSDLDIYAQSLGPAHQLMVDAGITSVELLRAGMTAYLWQIGQPQAAELFWTSGGKAQPASPPGSFVDPLGQGWGRGAYDEEFDAYEWYERPEDQAGQGDGLSWARILADPDLIVADLSDRGIELFDRSLLMAMPARWLRLHIEQCFTTDSRLRRKFATKEG